ncbi:unnamed protein product [Strongylus vulgaris]|uniref:Uncharacterized protein n=1 Tax=Strongylus vulgaris TaxID=40348 RepID=A0A3P7JGR8_STRVU|nr:unnamed protein product [Strongylus vulgaris]
MKKRTENEKHKMIIDSVSGAFVKADEEKARWKERRDAETERELARIEAEKPYKKKVVAPQPKKEQEKPSEPKRTVRKIVKDKQATPAAVKVPTFAMVPKPLQVPPKVAETPPAAPTATPSTKVAPAANKAPSAAAPAAPVMSFAFVPKLKSPPPKAAAAPAAPSVGAPQANLPLAQQKIQPASMEKPKIPKNDNVINEDTYDLFEAATNVATRRRKSLAELKARKELQTKSVPEPNEASVVAPKTVPKGDGAAATKIRNALGNTTNIRKNDSPSPKPLDVEKPSKRYSTRRKTQEIVNESAEPKIKKRRQLFKRNRFTRDPHDIDILLGWEKENTFELMEQMFMKAGNERVNASTHKKVKRAPATKIWISDLTVSLNLMVYITFSLLMTGAMYI